MFLAYSVESHDYVKKESVGNSEKIVSYIFYLYYDAISLLLQISIAKSPSQVQSILLATLCRNRLAKRIFLPTLRKDFS